MGTFFCVEKMKKTKSNTGGGKHQQVDDVGHNVRADEEHNPHWRLSWEF